MSMSRASRWTHKAAILLYSSYSPVVLVALCIGFIPYSSIELLKRKTNQTPPLSSAPNWLQLVLRLYDIDDFQVNKPAFFGLASMLGIFLLILLGLLVVSVLKCSLCCECTRNNRHLRSQRLEVIYRTLLGLSIPIYIPIYLVHFWPMSFLLEDESMHNVLWAVGCYMGLHILVLGSVCAFVILIGPPILYSGRPSMTAFLYILSVALVGSLLFGLIIIDVLHLNVPYSDLLIVCYIHIPTIVGAYTLLYIFTIIAQDGCKCSCGEPQSAIETTDTNTSESIRLLEGN